MEWAILNSSHLKIITNFDEVWFFWKLTWFWHIEMWKRQSDEVMSDEEWVVVRVKWSVVVYSMCVVAWCEWWDFCKLGVISTKYQVLGIEWLSNAPYWSRAIKFEFQFGNGCGWLKDKTLFTFYYVVKMFYRFAVRLCIQGGILYKLLIVNRYYWCWKSLIKLPRKKPTFIAREFTRKYHPYWCLSQMFTWLKFSCRR